MAGPVMTPESVEPETIDSKMVGSVLVFEAATMNGG
jgi:hypothetical protein